MHRFVLTAAALVFATAASANDYAPAMERFLKSNIRAWAENPVLIEAINAQNAKNANIGQSDIDAMDKAWRAEVGQAATPTIDPVLHNAAADFLRQQVAASGGMITEVFAMDSHGLNVAASSVTSDMWQGDEAKFTESYGYGPDAVHLGDVEFDESTQTYQSQISIPLIDPASGALVGALTVGVNADALM